MLKRHVIAVQGERDYRITTKGMDWLQSLGVPTDELLQSRRNLARRCLDWTERRPHVGGALGAALMQQFLAEGWLARTRGSRGLRITQKGLGSFTRLGLPVAAMKSPV